MTVKTLSRKRADPPVANAAQRFASARPTRTEAQPAPGASASVDPPFQQGAQVAPPPPEAVDPAQMLERYGVKTRGFPVQKFLMPLAAIDQALHSSADPSAVATAVDSHDLRRNIFQLEGLLRLYEKDLGKKFEPMADLVKELEDDIGTVAEFRNALQRAVTRNDPPEVTRRIRALADSARQGLVDLVAEKWMPGKHGRSHPVKELLRLLAKHDFGSASDDRKRMAKRLSQRASKALEELHTLPMSQPESGVHRLRRQLRWLSLYMEGTGGVVQDVPTGNRYPHWAREYAAATPEEKSLHNQGLVPAPEGRKTIDVPLELHFALHRAIHLLGVFKDDHEAHELISSALRDQGKSEAEIAASVGRVGSVADVEERATSIRDELKDHWLLEGLIAAFDAAS